MGRIKKSIKAKEPVKLRSKDLANGNKSLYLDIYLDGVRTYEFLKLYIIPEKTQADKIANSNTLQVANAIKSERLLEIANGKAGLKTNKGKILFVDWLKKFLEIKKQTRSYSNAISATIRQIELYKGGKVMLNQVDKNYLVGYFQFLDNKEKALSNNTKYCHYLILSGALNMALQKGFINENPLQRLSRDEKPHPQESNRAFLTVDEVKRLEQTECRNEQVKRAFLFACFCGLRVSDIKALTWSDITIDNGQYFANLIQEKTDVRLRLPLSEQAVKWLPERDPGAEYIFSIPQPNTTEKILDRWRVESGIDKHVTFHVSRHTFATLSLTAGVDLYTTSKLLGHTNVKTTQIYAKIVDQKKNEAVNMIGNLFNNI